MTATQRSVRAGEVVQAFLDAPTASLNSSFRQLAATLRNRPTGARQATATQAGHAAVPELVAGLADAPADRRPHLALMLGLLADSDAHDGVRSRLDSLLALFATAVDDHRLVAALLYGAGLFPEDAERVLSAADSLTLGADDRSRLERSLVAGRPADPVLVRVWPSPAMWAITDEELEADRRQWGALPDQQISALWEDDTQKLRDYAAMKAIALLDAHAGPYAAECDSFEPDTSGPRPAEAVPQATATGRLAPFEGLLACPDCRGKITLGDGGAHCGECDGQHSATGGWLDLSSSAGQGMDAMILNDATQVPRYEHVLRPAFLRVMGRDFEGTLSVQDEISFLTRHVRSADGPVLDLAAGSGRFTRVLADVLGPDQLVALDLSTSMLTALQAAGPELPAVRASAVNLPFADASLSAVTCWNALQTLPSKDKAIAEVGRCLRPGGTFTLFTFRPDEDVLYREFQIRQERALRVELPPRDSIVRWLEEAGLTVREETGPGGYLFISAVRENRR